MLMGVVPSFGVTSLLLHFIFPYGGVHESCLQGLDIQVHQNSMHFPVVAACSFYIDDDSLR